MIYYEITVLFHVTENTFANTIDATYSGCMMGTLDVTHIVEFATVFLYSDWLFLRWHDINNRISHQHEPFSCSNSNHSIHTVSCGHGSQKCQHGG